MLALARNDLGRKHTLVNPYVPAHLYYWWLKSNDQLVFSPFLYLDLIPSVLAVPLVVQLRVIHVRDDMIPHDSMLKADRLFRWA